MTISVVIQGGAMRSIYCVGAVRALIDFGYASQVRTIHTASAGCVAGLLLASHVAHPNSPSVADMRDSLLDRLAGRRFINVRRPAKVVDVGYLAQTMAEVTAISPKELADHGLAFEVGMTDARTGAARYIDVATAASESDLFEAFRASMALPALYPERVVIDGRRYLDGGISDPLPVLRALTRSPTTLVAISSVAASHVGVELEGYEPWLVRLAPGMLSSPVRHLLLTRNPLGAASEALTERGDVAGVRMVRIAPHNQRDVGSRLETSPERLLQLEELGYQHGRRVLEQTSAPAPTPEPGSVASPLTLGASET